MIEFLYLYFGIGLGIFIVYMEDMYEVDEDLHPIISIIILTLFGGLMYCVYKFLKWRGKL